MLILARQLLDRGALTRDALIDLDRQVRDEAAAAAQFALKSPLPTAESVFEHAYA